MAELERFIAGVGALSEALGLFRSELKKNGFDEQSITALCCELMKITVKGRDD